MLTMTATTATAMAAKPTRRMVATMATMTKMTWTAMAAATTTRTMMTSTTTTRTMGWQRCDGNDDDGTIMIWW